MYKLAIDVGGTNTDAVIIDDQQRVIAQTKQQTTADIYTGIVNACTTVVDEANIPKDKIVQAMLGTTQSTNAIVERKHLAKVGFIRIGAPATLAVKPMIDWDETIKATVVHSIVIGGGFEHDGKELAPLDVNALRSFLTDNKNDVEAIAISCVFATIRNDHELQVAEIAREMLGEDIPISMSHEIGAMGLIERENATILNACLHHVADMFTNGFAKSLHDDDITHAKVYLSQNDGTLMTLDEARNYPILTVACGPTNSIRGASYLSQLQEAIVLDIGGTTTDVGSIHNGFPRESSAVATVGGVRTNFRMPDIMAIGLGGGSIVRVQPDGAVTVGPDSVGYEIHTKALIFGGDTLTATDIAVRLGMVELGDATLVAHIDQTTAEQAMAVITATIEDALDAMKLSQDPVDVVLVGGGSIIVPTDLVGAKTVHKPEHSGVANAIGAAISKVSGTYEALVDYNEVDRDAALEQAKQGAIDLAVEAGAIRSTVEIVDIEDVPLAYYKGNTSRLKVKAAGDLLH